MSGNNIPIDPQKDARKAYWEGFKVYMRNNPLSKTIMKDLINGFKKVRGAFFEKTKTGRKVDTALTDLCAKWWNKFYEFRDKM